MKFLLKPLLLVAVLGSELMAQSSGQITYEAMQKVDMSQMRVVINGQTVQPGSPEFPSDVPDVRTFETKFQFAGNNGKEVRENNGMMIRTFVGGPGGPANDAPRQTTNLQRPFEEQTYLDLTNRKYVTELTVKDGSESKVYRAEQPFLNTPAGWTESGQTKKIAGYVCQKATVPHRGETYTVWYTTELPFSYSPVRALIPAKGVVLALEGSRESFKATKVDLKAAVSEKDLQPKENAEKVSSEQLQELRQKALANFRAQMMNQMERN